MLTAEEMVKSEIEKWNQIKRKNQPKPPKVTEEQIRNKKREVDERRMHIMHCFLLKVLPSIEDFQPKTKNDRFTQLEYFFVLLSENTEAKALFKSFWEKANPKHLPNILE